MSTLARALSNLVLLAERLVCMSLSLFSLSCLVICRAKVDRRFAERVRHRAAASKLCAGAAWSSRACYLQQIVAKHVLSCACVLLSLQESRCVCSRFKSLASVCDIIIIALASRVSMRLLLASLALRVSCLLLGTCNVSHANVRRLPRRGRPRRCLLLATPAFACRCDLQR